MSGISLHAGVSRGAAGRLHSPAVDARDLAAAAAARGFGVQRVLIDCSAELFLEELGCAVARLRGADTLLLTFSGHGRVGAWCFADRDLALRDVCSLLSSRRRGTRVVIVSDACHSESWPALDDDVTLIAPAESHPLDGRGANTRSPFTAALIREWSAGVPPAVVGRPARRRAPGRAGRPTSAGGTPALRTRGGGTAARRRR
ncbi:MAG TPA: caspase family protein [Thermoanaerobaculia bacterium]|nr:caspase family protein [Thermoanaerobaculia bacterium]